jgi:beta-fructofuranosidase
VADSLDGPWRRPANDIVLPAANHAFSPVVWGERTLLYNWIAAEFDWHPLDKGRHRAIAPPKEATAGPDGELVLRSFEPGWRSLMQGGAVRFDTSGLEDSSRIYRGKWRAGTGGLDGRCEPGMGLVRLPEAAGDFMLEVRITLHDAVEAGAFWRADDTANECTRVSLIPGRQRIELHRLVHRVNYNAIGRGFDRLQDNFCPLATVETVTLQVIAWGPYIELSVDGRVLLANFTMSRRDGHLGFFVEDGRAAFDQATLTRLIPPQGF